MKIRRHTLLLGLALVALLIVGPAVAVLWPEPPSEAEQALARLHDGMTLWSAYLEIREPAGPSPLFRYGDDSAGAERFCELIFPDGSAFTVRLRPAGDDLGHLGVNPHEKQLLVLPATEILPIGSKIMPLLGPTPKAVPITPLTRLRRTLARLLPALKE